MNYKFLLAAITSAAICIGTNAKTNTSDKTSETATGITVSDVWIAYDAFNDVYLDRNKYIYKNTDRDHAAKGRDRGAAAIWCQPMYVDMAINAVEFAKKDRKSVV